LCRSYDAIIGVSSQDWLHQLGEEAVSLGITPQTKEEIFRYHPMHTNLRQMIRLRVGKLCGTESDFDCDSFLLAT
jgi:hypothetical protein